MSLRMFKQQGLLGTEARPHAITAKILAGQVPSKLGTMAFVYTNWLPQG